MVFSATVLLTLRRLISCSRSYIFMSFLSLLLAMAYMCTNLSCWLYIYIESYRHWHI